MVFNHGWPLSGDDWDNQMLLLLGKGYRFMPTNAVATADRARSVTATTWSTTRPMWPPSSSISTCTLRSRSGIRRAEARRRATPPGTAKGRVAKAGTRSARSRRSCCGHRRTRAACRSRCSTASGSSWRAIAHSSIKDLASGPFYGYNRPGANVTQGVRDTFCLQGMIGGLKLRTTCDQAVLGE